MPLRLVRPAAEHLPAYADALRRGFEPSTYDGPAIAAAHLAAIAADAGAFLARLDDPEARGGPITLPDGRQVPRLPGFSRWMIAGGFAGVIHCRWQNDTPELPDHVLGHIGYQVVPWRRGEGHATRALALLLEEIAPLGLPWVELTTTPGNAASIRVIERNDGVLVGRFAKHPAYGGDDALRYRIALPRG